MTAIPTARNRPGRRGLVLALALLRACRPRQWLKNLLVFAAPATAGALADPRAVLLCLATFGLFCLASAGTYLLNDVRDARHDRRHPRKRHRPIASGELPVPIAVVVGVLAVLVAPVASLVLGNGALSALIAGYVLLTLLYTRFLKTMVVVDLVAVASCHVLRAMAGGIVVGVVLTSWFMIVVSLAALLVVVGKREAELRATGTPEPVGEADLGEEDGTHPTRAALLGYTTDYLSRMRTVASGAMIVTYCLWALEQGGGPQSVFHAVSIVPFVMFVLRYNLLVDRGSGEEPEEIALKDRPLQATLLSLVLLIGLGIHL
ncbi:decaprenyl-phosphate phosphoribosyltransferase [Nocardiopsis alba]|uniref:decaprenyl-phosphate phosphoribosyltransferase n=1 Tax=Nocardiopsis TaxID=2013 RepID=UPI002DBB9018|nr:decaprenyl-phosphate phosphoribosyltransferase [Nocardiopsis sp. LDBS1602]MEC3895000.1 decaprenyl-phosphate phosphoribosyltransferase [Nocardiopsis sp. LDBS1602]